MGGPIGPDLRVIYGTAALAPLQQVTVHVLLRCSGHQETSGSNAAVSALKSGEIRNVLSEAAAPELLINAKPAVAATTVEAPVKPTLPDPLARLYSNKFRRRF